MDDCGLMVFDVLLWIKNNVDLILVFCCFCCEGVCGFCLMNIGGCNIIVCILGIEDYNGMIIVLLLLYQLVVCDLVLDLM